MMDRHPVMDSRRPGARTPRPRARLMIAAALAEAEAEGGVSATGAWVTPGEREILFVPVDPQSAGYDGSPRDRLRELQARTLNRAVSAGAGRAA